MINLLAIIDKGIAYKTDRTLGPAIRHPFGGFARDDKDLANVAAVSFSEIDLLIREGFAEESEWEEYTSLRLSYKGKKTLLDARGWSFNAWLGRGSACCDKAIPRFCVCRNPTQCPIHGSQCHGSHD